MWKPRRATNMGRRAAVVLASICHRVSVVGLRGADRADLAIRIRTVQQVLMLGRDSSIAPESHVGASGSFSVGSPRLFPLRLRGLGASLTQHERFWSIVPQVFSPCPFGISVPLLLYVSIRTETIVRSSWPHNLRSYSTRVTWLQSRHCLRFLCSRASWSTVSQSLPLMFYSPCMQAYQSRTKIQPFLS